MQRINKIQIIGFIFFIIGLSFISYNRWEDYNVNKNTKTIIRDIKEKIEKDSETNDDSVPDYIKNPNMEMPIITINGYEYIGYIEIPSLDIELPVLSSWSYPKLKVSPARYEGSVYLNNMIILAHNYRAHFGKLYQLEEGELMIFRDMDNNLFEYTIEKKEELKATQVEEMVSGNWDLTLFTCTLGGEARNTIRSKLVKKDHNRWH